MSSTVTIPAKPPYSSITNAISSPASVSWVSVFGSGSDDGTRTAGRHRDTSGRGRVGVEHRVQVDDTQQLVGGVADDGVAGVAGGHPGEHCVDRLVESDRVHPGAGIMACSAVLVGKSRTRSSSVDRSRGISPATRDAATMCSRSRAVAECSTIVHRFHPQRAHQHVRRLVEQPDQPAEQPQIPLGRRRQRAGDRLGNRDREVLRAPVRRTASG